MICFKTFPRTGWGQDSPTSSPSYLKQSMVPLVANEQCKKQFSINIDERSMICLGGTGSSACMGDSGGPLVCEESGKWYLRGAASFVTSRQCPRNKYSVYARVSSYIDWIKDKIGKSTILYSEIYLNYILLNIIFINIHP